MTGTGSGKSARLNSVILDKDKDHGYCVKLGKSSTRYVKALVYVVYVDSVW